MDHPSVDVVIATRGDRPDMLEEAVRSVVSQDYPGSIVLIVVYDRDEVLPSPVELPESDHRAGRHVYNSSNHGLAQARNRGVAEGSAELVAFLDDDDLWAPGKLTAQVQLLAGQPQAPLVGTGIVIRGADGRETPRPAPSAVVTHADLLRSRVTELHPSGFLIRRTALDRAGGVDEELPGAYSEDYDLVLRISAAGADIAMVVEPLTVVRWTGGSYFFSRWETISKALRHLLAKHPDLAADRRGAARIWGQIAFAEAAAGHRRRALRALGEAVRCWPLERRVPVAALAVLGVPANSIQAVLHRRGRGV
jgi:GT2 family glycosyltransferase